MKNKEDVLELKKKAYEVYEKLSVLAYVDEYINTTPNAEVTKEELINKVIEAEERRDLIEKENEQVPQEKIENSPINDVIPEKSIVRKPIISETPTEDITVNSSEEKSKEEEPDEEIVVKHILEEEPEQLQQEPETSEKNNESVEHVEKITEQPFDELEELLFSKKSDTSKNDVKDIGERKTPTLEEELNDTLPVDVMANLFEKAEPKKSLNDHLQNTIQIGLNDRIAFVKHLFEGNQTDFNRVISQLNTCKTEKEAKKFINKLIKPDYDWSEKEEYETRLLEIIERRFA
ncbi:hypothetical protein [Tenacibaculum sp. MAR_2009_124]|uniref:hypothetical protein n=1 Tax=Tenacibaculum sp. MAR_2009_124 TaxID=1250059 RepID=UPI0021007863|nr:hypothetical protein [Tenacibaculum sp. MAR_2009_124]